MTAYDLTVNGCDASTRVFALDLDDAEHLALVRVVTAVNNAGTEQCQPTITLAVTPPTPDTAFCMECFTDATADEGLVRDRLGEWCHARCLEVAF